MRGAASFGVAMSLAQAVATVSVHDVARADGASGAADAAAVSLDEETERVLALSSDAAYGEYLAGECASCHAADPAARPPDGTVPVIHGAGAASIVRALLEYRSGVRSNTTMGSVAGALNDEEIAALARYLASLSQARK